MTRFDLNYDLLVFTAGFLYLCISVFLFSIPGKATIRYSTKIMAPVFFLLGIVYLMKMPLMSVEMSYLSIQISIISFLINIILLAELTIRILSIKLSIIPKIGFAVVVSSAIFWFKLLSPDSIYEYLILEVIVYLFLAVYFILAYAIFKNEPKRRLVNISTVLVILISLVIITKNIFVFNGFGDQTEDFIIYLGYFSHVILLAVFVSVLGYAFVGIIKRLYPAHAKPRIFLPIYIIFGVIGLLLILNFSVTNHFYYLEKENIEKKFFNEAKLSANAIKNSHDDEVSGEVKPDSKSHSETIKNYLDLLKSAKPDWDYISILTVKEGKIISILESEKHIGEEVLAAFFVKDGRIESGLKSDQELVEFPLKVGAKIYAGALSKIPPAKGFTKLKGYIFVITNSANWLNHLYYVRSIAISIFFFILITVLLVLFRQMASLESNLKTESSEEQLSRIFFSIPEAFVIINRKGEIIKYNESFLTTFKINESEVSAFSIESIIKVDSGDNIDLKELFDSIMETEKQRLNVSFKSPHEENYIFLEMAISKTSDSFGDNLIISMRDITDRVNTEKQLLDAINRAKIEQDIISLIASNPHFYDELFESAVREILELASIALKTERVSLWRFNSDETELKCFDLFEVSSSRHSSGYTLKDTDFKKEFEYLKSSKFIDANDPYTDSRTSSYSKHYLTPNNITSLLDAVIRISGKNNGVVCFEHVNKNHYWQPDEITFACQVADQIALLMMSEERRKTEKQLMEAEELYRSLITTSPDGISLSTMTGTITYTSPSLLKIFGYSDESEVLGKSIFEFVDEEDIPKVNRNIEKLFNGIYSGSNKYKFRKKDGTFFIGEIVTSIVKNDKREPTGMVSVLRDITQRLNTEEALKNQDVRVRNLFENVPIGMFQSTFEGKYVYANTRLALILGYSSSEELIKAAEEAPIHELIYLYPEERSSLLKDLTDAPQRWKTVNIKLKRKDGDILDVRMTASIRPDPISGILFLYGFTEDITERKRMEDITYSRLELSEYSANHSLPELMQKTIDIAEKLTDSKIGFFHFVEPDQKSVKLLAWSTQTEKTYCKADPKSMHYDIEKAGIWVDCIKVRKPVIHNDYHNISNKKGFPKGHAELVRELVVPIIRNEFVVAILGVGNKETNYNEKDIIITSSLASLAWDIISRKKIEIELLASEKRYRLLFDGMLNGFALHEIICNENNEPIDYRFLEVNPAFERLTGLSASEIINKKAKEVLPGLEDYWVKFYGEVALKGESKTFENYSLELNKYYHVEAFCPEPGKFATVIEDITEKRANEIAISDSNRMLEETLVKLKETQKQVLQQERLRALGQLASGIAHDINNSLTPIVMGVDFFEEDDYIVKSWSNVLSRMKKSSQDIANTISKMREFYRIRASDDDFTLCNLNKLIYDSIELTSHRWKDMFESLGVNIEIVTDLDDSIPQTSVNVSEIREALINLIFNACDAMPDGGKITFRSYLNQNLIVVEVSDTGHGMNEETKQHCFEPFYSTKGDKGSGLGLSMVYGIIERHKGKIEVESEIDKGTLIRIVLEADPGSLDSKNQNKQNDTSQELPPLKILCVDDEESIREMLFSLLSRKGHLVTTAKNGDEASGFFENAMNSDLPFHVVITDLGMAGMDGLSLAKKIKTLKNDIPVILLTGWGVFYEKQEIEGIDYLLRKPVSARDLFAALAYVISYKGMENT